MVNYPHNNLFNRGDTDRQLRIDFTGGTITNKEMHQGSFSLTESLCSEECLTFGSCESSVLTFKVHNVLTPLAGQELTVYEVLNGNTAEPFQYGKYKVQSDKPTADRKYRDVVAYDAMYDILNADVASWYNTLLPEETTTTTLKKFRDSFFSYLGIEQEEIVLINDDIVVEKTVKPEQLSGKTVINCICELNGAFGHINRSGKFQYVILKPISSGLYPSETLYPSEKLYPRESNANELFFTGKYISCKYDDFETKFITGIQIRQEEDDIGATVGTTENAYVVEDNFLVYGKSHDELTTIANNLLSVIDNIYYRPIDYVKTNGKPYLEVGDNISVSSSEVIIETYILERTIKAVKGQMDEFSAKGTEYYPKEVNGLNKQITQLKGKTNKLIRTVDETRLEMEDIEKSLYSEISITAGQLRAELSNVESGLNSSIVQTASNIRAELTDVKSGLESSISLTASEIRSEVSNIENGLQSQITQNANAISLRVTSSELESEINALDNKISLRVTSSELESEIAVLERKINLKVDSGDIINEINISDEAIELKGNRLIVNSTNFKLDESGNAEFSGIISGGGISLETKRKTVKEVMKTTVYDYNDNVTLEINEADDFDKVDLYGPVYIIGGTVSESFLGVSELDCSNLTVGSDAIISGDVECNKLTTVNLYCNFFNGYTPITTGNIGNYIPDTSDFVSISDFNSLEKEVSFNTRYINIITGSLDIIGNEIADLQSRVSALEASL